LGKLRCQGAKGEFMPAVVSRAEGVNGKGAHEGRHKKKEQNRREGTTGTN